MKSFYLFTILFWVGLSVTCDGPAHAHDETQKAEPSPCHHGTDSPCGRN